VGSKTKLGIETDKLADATGKAGETLAASAVKAIPPPPPTATSQLDAALVLVTTSSEALRAKVDTTVTMWATKQQAALTESPPALQQQDTQAAWGYQRTPICPMPAVKPPVGPPDVTGVPLANHRCIATASLCVVA
jgi:hypothetical protein